MAELNKIEGLDTLLKSLKQLPKSITEGKNGGPLGKALFASAKVISDSAKQNAPNETGRLAQNIVRRRVKNPKEAMFEVAISVRSSRKKSKDDPNNAWYWTFVEFGTEKQAAHPFLRPAFEGNREAYQSKFAADLRKKIALEAKKRNKKS